MSAGHALEGTVCGGSPQISIVVPCYNEVANVAPLVTMLEKVLTGRSWEVIFVDDHSPDGTTGAVREQARQKPYVRGICRIGRRGLSSAVIEGVLSSFAQVVVVMDGDLQHDESRIVALIEAVTSGTCDIAVGSRHVEGGSNAGLANAWRRALSDGGIWLAQCFLPVKLTDPMSGFFALRQETFAAIAPRLSGAGFKILLDLLLSSEKPLTVQEVACGFRPRVAGESKLDAVVMLQFAALLLEKFSRGMVPLRFVAFCLVGLVGVGVNLGVMQMTRLLGVEFSTAQGIGSVAAMIVNFFLDNSFTYRDRRLRGRRCLWGLVLFMLVCSVGAVADVGVAHMMYAQSYKLNEASLAGAVLAVVWNYAMSATIIWRAR